MTITAAGIGGQPIIDNIVVADPIAVPEPTTMALLVVGGAGAIAKRFRRREWYSHAVAAAGRRTATWLQT